MKENKVRYYPEDSRIEIDGKKYYLSHSKYKKVDGIEHIDYIVCKPKPEDMDKKKEVIVNKLKKELPPERFIEELLKKMCPSQITRLHNLLIKKETKVKRHDGCLGINIKGKNGNKMYLEFFD